MFKEHHLTCMKGGEFEGKKNQNNFFFLIECCEFEFHSVDTTLCYKK